MTAVNFPSSPTNGQTLVVGSKTYTYDAAKSAWTVAVESAGGIPITITDVVPVNIEDPNVTAVEYSATDSITVTGTGFDEVAFISIRGRYITGYTIVSDTEINITQIPNLSSGSYDIALLDENKSFAAVAQVTYNNERLVWSAQPASVYIIPDEAYSRSLKLNSSASFGETYSVSSSTPLPTGLTLSSSGVLSGTVASADVGSYPITILAKNEFEQTTSQSFTLVVRDKRWDVTALSESVDYGEIVSFGQSALTDKQSRLGRVFETTATAVHDAIFSLDGKHLYTVSVTNRFITHSYCSVPWDASTATLLDYFSYDSYVIPGGTITFVRSLAIKSDGTQIFMAGGAMGGNWIFVFDLASPWSLSNISLNQIRNMSGVRMAGIFFKPDGTRFWVVDTTTTSRVGEYDLPVAWDLATITDNSKNLTIYPNDITSTRYANVSFSDDGTKLFYGTSETAVNFMAVYTLPLTTPWTLNTTTTGVVRSTYTLNVPPGYTDQFVHGVIVKNETPIYAIVPTILYDISNLPLSGGPTTSYVDYRDFVNHTGVVKSASGRTFILSKPGLSSDTGEFIALNGSATSISSISNLENIVITFDNTTKIFTSYLKTNSGYEFEKTVRYAPNNNQYTQIVIGDGGKKIYLLLENSRKVHTYTLQTAYDIADIIYESEFEFLIGGVGVYNINWIQFSPDGTELMVLANNMISRYQLNTPWNVSTISDFIDSRAVSEGSTSFAFDYQTKSLTTTTSSIIENYTNKTWLDLSARRRIGAGIDSLPTHVTFNSDGTKMYISGDSLDTITQYTLSTPWDITTALDYFRITNSELFGQALTAGVSIYFKPDGTKLYVVSNLEDIVYQYTVNIPWEITSITYDELSLNVGPQELSPTGIFFKPDGTKMYIIGSSGDDINEYSLSTAWNISTAGFVQLFSVAAQETVPQDIFFKPDGTKMYIIGSSGDDINEYSLSTAWDVSTATFVQLFSVAAQETVPTGIHFKPDGLVVYIIGSSADRVFQYNLSTAWDISSASYSEIYYSTILNDTNPTGMYFKSDGTSLFILGGSSPEAVEEYYLDTPWMLSSARYRRTSGISFSSFETSPTGLHFSADGTKMYITGTSGDDINEFTLSSPWNIHNPTFVTTFSVATQETAPQDVFFKLDGTVMYTIGTGLDQINQYSLATAWDVSTAVFTQSQSVASQESSPLGFYFSGDGSRLYVTGSTGDDINQYSLTTPWDISTMSFVAASPSIASQYTSPNSVWLDPDGRYCYVCGVNKIPEALTAGTPTVTQLKFE